MHATIILLEADTKKMESWRLKKNVSYLLNKIIIILGSALPLNTQLMRKKMFWTILLAQCIG